MISYGIKIIKGEFHWISGIYASLEEGILGLFSDLADFTNEKSTMTGDSRQREDVSVFGETSRKSKLVAILWVD